MNKEKLRKKISALLEKTTDNGATKEEAFLALQKAEELMNNNKLTREEIEEEPCVLLSTDRPKQRFKEVFITAYLKDLFFTETYYTKTNVYFFGFKEDVDLCIYFYHFIIDSCFNDLLEYKKTSAYKLRKHYGEHAKSINYSYIKGYLMAVCHKIEKLYQDRQKQRAGTGLMVVEQKKAKVDKEFANLGLSLRSVQDKIGATSTAWNDGKAKGNELNIRQGVNTAKRDLQKKLN